jgi:hypothetical protein
VDHRSAITPSDYGQIADGQALQTRCETLANAGDAESEASARQITDRATVAML